MKARVRFAPSPTGMLHIGGARTAIFNYLFAKKNNADFILRIEDTDKERSTKQSIDAILDGMKILNLQYDEIYYQSKNQDRHKEIAMRLLKEGKAYEDYDSEKGTAIRIKVPKGETILNDLVRGRVEFNNKDIEDFVILRSDGTPTYHLAVVSDDIDMKITHIIRGDDHLANTPKHIILFNAIGVELPKFAHLPMIHDIEGKKLSKRKNAVAVSDYIELGYIPEAIKNYLLHLGSYGCYNKDIISEKEAIENFDISKLGKSPSRFDFDKLKYINLHYIKEMPEEIFLKNISERVELEIKRKINQTENERIRKITPELRKISTLKEIMQSSMWVLNDFEYISYYNNLFQEEKPNNFDDIIEKTQIKQFIANTNSIDEIKAKIKELTKQFNPQDIYQTIRYLLIGRSHSFGMNLILDTLGIEEVKVRIG